MTTRDHIKEAIDAAQSSLFARDYGEASRLIRKSVDEALNEQRNEDAAALSSILANYLSLGGDDNGALEAYARAERLQPDVLHHQLATAKHLYFQLRRRDEARTKVAALAAAGADDPHLLHKASALLGRFAVAEGSTDEAIRRLREAHDAAASANLLPLWWDLALVKKLVNAGCQGECRSYLEDLLARAGADNDDRVVEQVTAIIETFNQE